MPEHRSEQPVRKILLRLKEKQDHYLTEWKKRLANHQLLWHKKHGREIKTNITRHVIRCVWGYNKTDDGKHKNAEQVLNLLQDAKSKNMNLLLNTGPLPDGSIYPDDVKTLRKVGKVIQNAS